MLSVMLLREAIPEEAAEESFDREEEDGGDASFDIKMHRKTSTSKSTQVIENSEILRTKYGINAMDLENVELAEYMIIEMANME